MKKSSRVLFVVFLVLVSFIWIRCGVGVTYKIIRKREVIQEEDLIKQKKEGNSSGILNEKNPYVIPKKIHRLWINSSIELMPSTWRKSLNRCKVMHSDYSTRLWTDIDLRRLISTHYSWFLQTYDSYPYNIQRVDSARYFVLHRHGGIYLDLDIGCQSSMKPLVSALGKTGRGVLLPSTEPFGFSNDIMFASRHHPFFNRLILNLQKKNKWYGSPYLTVMFSTGPMFLSIINYELEQEDFHWVTTLSSELYLNKRIFRHHYGSSWHQSDAKFILWIQNNIIKISGCVIGFLLFIIKNKIKLNNCLVKMCRKHLKLPRMYVVKDEKGS